MKSKILRPQSPLIDQEVAVQEAVDQIHSEASTEALEALDAAIPFHRVVSLQSASGATPQEILSDAFVGVSKKAYITHWHAKVNGATAWTGTVTKVDIKDNNDTVIVSLPIGVLLSQALLSLLSAGITVGTQLSLSAGSAAGKGLKVVADANASIGGSDLVLTVSGYVK